MTPGWEPAADVVVIGGGPAGSAAARLLAAWGHSVIVLPGPTRRRPTYAESLPPSCRKPLEAIGMLDAVHGAGFLPNLGNLTSWGSADLTRSDFGAVAGFQVVREELDELLLRGAEAAGARVLYTRVAAAVRLRVEGHRSQQVELRGGAGDPTIDAPWILDCSGRSGVVARSRFRLPSSGPRTLALVGVWCTSGKLPEPNHTIVEAYRDGWAWSVPVARGLRYVAAMVDPDRTDLARAGGLMQMYEREVGKTRHLSTLLSAARLTRPPAGVEATDFCSSSYARDGVLLVGDAASFIDPLSSFGVKKALASGWLAAVVVNTVLRRPEMTDDALTLYEERERSVYAASVGAAREQYAIARERFGTDFWMTRSADLVDDGETAAAAQAWLEQPPGVGEDVLPIGRGDPRLREALQRIRGEPAPEFRVSPSVIRLSHPTVVGREVVLAVHVSAPGSPRPTRFHRGVNLPLLLELAPSHRDVPALYAAYQRRGGGLDLSTFLEALSALLALGFLEAA